MNDIFSAFIGLEHLIGGLVVPFCVALAACCARVAFWGWQGFRAFIANFTIAFVLGLGAHWLMLDTSLGGSTRTAITLGVALISKDLLDTIFSRATRRAMRERLAWEIRHRFTRPPHWPHHGSPQPWQEQCLPPDNGQDNGPDNGHDDAPIPPERLP